jgi:PadR family transcriptional regulator, regulatory protein PadR
MRSTSVNWISQLRKGLIEFCVLAVLESEEAYGYQILQRMNSIEGLEVSESTVYPILARLTKEGILRMRSAPSPSGPPRRYYQLTADGKISLNEMKSHWRLICDSVDTLFNHRSATIRKST